MPAASKMSSDEFQIDRYVVYPTHGVGKITDIETEELYGTTQSFFVIFFSGHKMTLRVPVERAKKAGLRPLSDGDDMDKAFKALSGKAKVKRNVMWSKRQQLYESKINSGNIVYIAEVVRDLHPNVDLPDRSYSERMIYESAFDRLAGEVAAAEAIDRKSAEKRVITILNKSKAEAAVQEDELEKEAA